MSASLVLALQARGQQAVDFTLKDLAGRPLTLSQVYSNGVTDFGTIGWQRGARWAFILTRG